MRCEVPDVDILLDQGDREPAGGPGSGNNEEEVASPERVQHNHNVPVCALLVSRDRSLVTGAGLGTSRQTLPQPIDRRVSRSVSPSRLVSSSPLLP